MRLPALLAAPGLRHAAPPSMFAPVDSLWSAYEAAAESNSLLTDMLTCASVNTLGDSIAQLTEHSAEASGAALVQDMRRTARFGVFGIADGAVAHHWFQALDATVGEDGTVAQTLTKVGMDMALYTPIWCVWFLIAFVVLERKDVRTIPSVLRSQFGELYRGNLGFFLPLQGVIYGCVPRNQRVLAEELANLVYTTLLSLWNHDRAEADEQQQPVVAAATAEGTTE